MVMGATYLLYSAYYLSSDFGNIFYIMSSIVAMLYVALAYTYTVNLRRNKKKVDVYLRMFNLNLGDQENIMVPSLRLKSYMLKWIMYGALGFALTKVCDFGMASQLRDAFARSRARIALQSLDFITLGMIVVACRPRKEWPPFFSLTVNEFGQG